MEEKNVESSEEKLKKEFNEFLIKPNTCLGCTAGLFKPDDYFNWKISFIGPKDTPYKGGLFFVRIEFPEDYPKSAPRINFITPIYHLQVWPYKSKSADTLGHVNKKALYYWKPDSSAREIITKLYAIFYLNNDDNPYLKDRVKEYRNNRDLFNSKASYFTKKYANSQNIKKGVSFEDKSWDFSVFKFSLIYNDMWKSFGKNLNYNNENEFTNKTIKLNVISNGYFESETIECELFQKTEEVLNQYLEKKKLGKEKQKNEKKIEIPKGIIEMISDQNDPEQSDESLPDYLFIFGLKRLDPNIVIGKNGLSEGNTITMIYNFKIKKLNEGNNE